MGEHVYIALAVEVGCLLLFITVWAVRRGGHGMASAREEAQMRRRARADREVRTGKQPHGGKHKPQTAAEQEATPPTPRELARNLPIPWGWPHYNRYRAQRMEKPTLSQSMDALIDSLVQEKRLVAPKITDPHFIRSMRVMLDDRRGLSRAQLDGVLPGHDQMDNQSRMPHVLANDQLRHVGILKTLQDGTTQMEYVLASSVTDIKRPWGW